MKINFDFEEKNVKLGLENQFTIHEFIEHTPVKILMLKGEKGDTVSAEWGTITGDLSSQTDLNTALRGKADKSTTYTKTEVDNAIPDVSNFIDKDVNNLTNYTKSSDLSDVATSGDYEDLTNTPTIPDVSNFITKDVNNLTNYTKTSDLSTVATSGDYNDLDNKPTIPSKVSDLTNDTGFITDKEDKTIYANDFKCKNLFGGFTFSQTASGITFTYNTNGSITVNGTATANAYSMYSRSAIRISLQPGTYTISGISDNVVLEVLGTNNDYLASTTSSKTFTITQTENAFVRLLVNSGTTLNNKTFNIQLELGDTATEFTPYKIVSQEDTGWVSIPLNSGYTGELYARKIGKIVNVIGFNINGSFGSSSNFATIPSEFIPSYQNNFIARCVNNSSNPYILINIASSNGLIRSVETSTRTETLQFSTTYFVG